VIGRPAATVPWLAALALAGCTTTTLLERPVPEKQRFVLSSSAPIPEAGAIPGVLRVDRVRVSPLFDSKGFVYRTGEDTFSSDFYHEFFAPPGEVLREAVIDWFEAASLFETVQPGSLPAPDWTLALDVERIYADRRDPAAPVAVLTVTARLVDPTTPTLEVRLRRRYEQVEPVADGSAQALVDAWGRALGRTLAELAPDLRAAAVRPAARRR
jgi:ABC-type uncharacterized transport system auxiliary subunit